MQDTGSLGLVQWDDPEGWLSGAVSDFIFLGFKFTVHSDCSHKIKKCLLLEGKLLKGKDDTLLTKVCRVKAMVFPIVMYVWMWELDVKKTEHQRIDAFKLWFWRRLLGVPWIVRSNQSILKEINPKYSLEGLMPKLKLQYLGHLLWRADLLEKTLILVKIEDRRRREWQSMGRWFHVRSGAHTGKSKCHWWAT